MGTAAITWYQWFLFAHIIAASAWAGGALALVALSIAARTQRDVAQEVTLVRLAVRIGGPYFGLSGLVLLGFGIALVENGNWGYDHFFITFGFAIWALSTLTGIFFYGSQGKRLDAALERGDDAALRRHLARYYWVGRLDTLGLVSAVFVMATKPFL